MSGLPFSENRIYTGNKGKLIDANGLVLQEVQEFSARITPEYTDVKVVGARTTGKKLNGHAGTGSMKIYQISNDLTRRISEGIRNGTPLVTQFVCEMGNDAGDIVRVLLIGVEFTGPLDIVKFAAQQLTDQDFEYSFSDHRYL